MPTRSQVQTIKLGARTCDLDDARYRLLLRNVAGVDSCTKLDNRGVEDVLAVLEDLGFDSHPAGPTYWRDTVRARGSACGERVAHKIRELAHGGRYDLAAMCLRQSGGRTDRVEQLGPKEGWQLIEAFKAIRRRDVPPAAGAPMPLSQSREDERERMPATGTEAGLNFTPGAGGTVVDVPPGHPDYVPF